MTEYPDFHGDMPIEHTEKKCSCNKQCKENCDCNCINCTTKKCKCIDNVCQCS